MTTKRFISVTTSQLKRALRQAQHLVDFAEPALSAASNFDHPGVGSKSDASSSRPRWSESDTHYAATLDF